MLTQNPITCIEKNCQFKISRGATRDTIIEYLDHLKNGVWKFNSRVATEIDYMIEEILESNKYKNVHRG
jgi:hypothetical protein